jgi:glutathione S-transferase
MLLYDSRVSGNCYKVRLLAAQMGIALERRETSSIAPTAWSCWAG